MDDTKKLLTDSSLEGCSNRQAIEKTLRLKGSSEYSSKKIADAIEDLILARFVVFDKSLLQPDTEGYKN